MPILLLLVVCVSSQYGLVQQERLQELFTDKETGEPMMGARVVVVGTKLGAATDISGHYTFLKFHRNLRTAVCFFLVSKKLMSAR